MVIHLDSIDLELPIQTPFDLDECKRPCDGQGLTTKKLTVCTSDFGLQSGSAKAVNFRMSCGGLQDGKDELQESEDEFDDEPRMSSE